MSKRKEKNKILFVYLSLPSFVRRDLEILERHFNVKRMNVATFLVPQRSRDPLVFLKLLKGILWADVVYSWFADLNAFFIVLFSMFLRKKCIIVVGGYDVVYIPEIDYGDLKSLWSLCRVKFVLEHATKILPFSSYAKERVLSITKKANICVIPLACDTEKFKSPIKNKENLVITACLVTENNIKRKGLKTFVESAKFLPQLKFALIGPQIDNSVNYLKKLSPPNVEFTDYVSDEELVRWYQRAKVYCQLSYEEGEGAGGALGEAMSCGCVPVVSEKAVALKETVGSYGFYVPYGDVITIAKAIELALRASPELGAKIRKRMVELFSLKKREHALVKLIKAL
jgi:glycosyltransferase involved in cell wall biosynthesis